MPKINFSISNIAERHYPKHNPDARSITNVPNFPNCYMLKGVIYGYNWYIFTKNNKWFWGKELGIPHAKSGEGFNSIDECYAHLKNILKGVFV